MIKIPDVQAEIDAQVLPYIGKFVEYVRYLPRDEAPPADASHVLTLASADGADKVQVAVKAKGFYGTVLSLLLKGF